MKKILLSIVAVFAMCFASRAVGLDTFTGVSNVALLVEGSVANSAVITGAAVNVKTIKGISTWAAVSDNGTNTAGSLTVILQDSADGSTAWSNVTAVTFASTNCAGFQWTKVDRNTTRAYLRVIGVSTADAHRVSSSYSGYK